MNLKAATLVNWTSGVQLAQRTCAHWRPSVTFIHDKTSKSEDGRFLALMDTIEASCGHSTQRGCCRQLVSER